MRVKILEDVLKDGTATYSKDDQFSVDEGKGALWVKLGWAENLDTGEVNPRKPGAHKIAPDNVKQAST